MNTRLILDALDFQECMLSSNPEEKFTEFWREERLNNERARDIHPSYRDLFEKVWLDGYATAKLEQPISGGNQERENTHSRHPGARGDGRSEPSNVPGPLKDFRAASVTDQS